MNTGEHPALHDTQPACHQRFISIEKRLDGLEKAEWRGEIEKVNERLDKLNDKITEQSLKMAKLTGWIAGATAIGSVVGGLASTLLQHFMK